MRWSRLLLLALLAVLPSCVIFGSSGPTLPPTLPPNFQVGIKVLEAVDPPVDYQIMVNRSGDVTYETTVRVPRRHTFQGTLELNEADILALYDAVLASSFDEMGKRYAADAGASDRRENGERVFYVAAGDVDKRIDVSYATVEPLDRLQAAIIAQMPAFVLSGEGGPDSIHGRPEAFVGDRATKVFHHPDCELCEKIDASGRESYTNEYDALNFGYHPCELCRPLETRK